MSTGFRGEGINVDKNSGELFFGNLSFSYLFSNVIIERGV